METVFLTIFIQSASGGISCSSKFPEKSVQQKHFQWKWIIFVRNILIGLLNSQLWLEYALPRLFSIHSIRMDSRNPSSLWGRYLYVWASPERRAALNVRTDILYQLFQEIIPEAQTAWNETEISQTIRQYEWKWFSYYFSFLSFGLKAPQGWCVVMPTAYTCWMYENCVADRRNGWLGVDVVCICLIKMD